MRLRKFWVKKNNVPTESDLQFEKRLQILEQRAALIDSYRTTKEISDDDLQSYIDALQEDIEKFKDDYNNRTYNELVGSINDSD